VSLHWRLVLLVLALMVPTLAASLWILNETYDGQRRAMERTLRETARALAQVVDRELARRENIARMLADSPFLDLAPEVPDADRERFHAQARRATEGLRGWVVLSSPTLQILNTLRPVDQPLPERPSQGESRFPFATDQPVLSNFAVGRVSGQLVASFQAPVRRNGQTWLNVGVTVLPAELQTLIDNQRLPEGWIAAVFDRAATIAARHPDPGRWVGTSASAEMQRRSASSNEGFFESVSLDGHQTVAFFSRSPAYGWTFVLAVPRSQFGSTIMRSIGEEALIALGLLAVSIVAAVWLGQRIAEPVRALRDAARELEQGRPVLPVSTGIRECDDVSQALAQASRRILNARTELEERVDEAVKQTQEVQQRLSQSQRVEALGRLTGGVAHDFNNLLAVIGNSTYVLKRSAPQADLSAPLAAITRAVEAGSRLTQHLLRFARRQAVRPEVCDLREYLPGTRELLTTVVGSAIEVAVQVHPDTRPVEIDTVELELALINIALNARDAMPVGGRLTVTAGNAKAADTRDLPPGDYVSIAVSDTGTGMAPELVERVFEPFFTTKEVGRGTGLGLSQVHGFCAQAGGAARVGSTPGEGSTITLVLPATTHEALASEPATAVLAPSQPHHVLLVEDNADLGTATEALLSDAGYRVSRASNADGALAMLHDAGNRIDVVLSDIVMPGSIDGIGLARELRESAPQLPVLLISGYAAELREPHGFDILHKPCPPETLLRALRLAMERTQPA
jgi:signal transduction histidine kinase